MNWNASVPATMSAGVGCWMAASLLAERKRDGLRMKSLLPHGHAAGRFIAADGDYEYSKSTATPRAVTRQSGCRRRAHFLPTAVLGLERMGCLHSRCGLS